MPITSAACWPRSRWAPAMPRPEKSSRLCETAGITLAVNQNMRYDHSVRACKTLLDRGELGEPVLATIDMRAIPHWMPWQQRLGWVTLRIMSIHHLDTFRYWFGEPERVFCQRAPRSPHREAVRPRRRHLPVHPGVRRRRAGRQLGRRLDRSGPRGRGRGHRHSLAGRGDRGAGPRHDRLAQVSAPHAQHAGLHLRPAGPRWYAAALERGLVSRRLRRADGRIALRPGRRAAAALVGGATICGRWPWSKPAMSRPASIERSNRARSAANFPFQEQPPWVSTGCRPSW